LIPERLENGNLLVPVGGWDEELGVFTDSVVEVGPDHPSYAGGLAGGRRAAGKLQ
jgi:hypothetical protein